MPQLLGVNNRGGMSAAASQAFVEALCVAALQAKASYELAYEAAELKGGSERM